MFSSTPFCFCAISTSSPRDFLVEPDLALARYIDFLLRYYLGTFSLYLWWLVEEPFVLAINNLFLQRKLVNYQKFSKTLLELYSKTILIN